MALHFSNNMQSYTAVSRFIPVVIVSISLLLIQNVNIATIRYVDAGDIVLPAGVTPVDIDALPSITSEFGHTSEAYESGVAAAVVGLRRAMHEQPGIMYDEYFASETAYETLKLIGIEEHNIKKDLGITGLVAV